jgi:hypothetical protein
MTTQFLLRSYVGNSSRYPGWDVMNNSIKPETGKERQEFF